MRPILCVIDLTESSRRVLEVAARMAYAYKSQVTVLFPYRLIDNSYSGEVSKLKVTLEKEAEEKFLALRKHIPLLDSVGFEFHPEIGFPADRISFFVRKNKVDSIVISQRQANLVNEINSATLQNLIANLKLPFTIVPEEAYVEVLSQ